MYPYIASSSGYCKYDKQEVVSGTMISNYEDVEQGMEYLMMAVAQQPVSIGVDASGYNW